MGNNQLMFLTSVFLFLFPLFPPALSLKAMKKKCPQVRISFLNAYRWVLYEHLKPQIKYKVIISTDKVYEGFGAGEKVKELSSTK